MSAQTLKIYDTLGKGKRAFEPLQAGRVNMYVCGVTVYADCHLGHARAAITFDMVYRYLLHRGYDVTYARNFTDVDDKIINKAIAEGSSARDVATRYIASFYRDMDALGLLRPDHEPKVTEYIPQIKGMVQALIDNGHAYVVDGDVYYDVSSKADYGKLSGRNLEDQESGARVHVDDRKRHPFDFALWKATKQDEPSDVHFDAPWGGTGRPGWHIECSAMSTSLLGPTLDIHGGGRDLIFPHHENEIAQSEGATGQQPFARYWMHNGHLTLNAEKMSKSLGNLFSIQEVLSCYHPESVRMFFFTAQYRGPVDFNEDTIREAEAQVERLYRALAELDRLLGDELPRPTSAPFHTREHLYAGADPLEGFDPTTLAGPDRGIYARTTGLVKKIQQAMDDDFNTAAALGHVFDFVKHFNRWLRDHPEAAEGPLRPLVAGARHQLMLIGSMLGLFTESPATFFDRLKQRRLAFVGLDESVIEGHIAARTEARVAKDFARSDAIRDELQALGVELKDGPQGTSWTVVRGLTEGA